MSSHHQPYVATIVAPRGAVRLASGTLAALASLLPDVSEPLWLDPGQAADLPFASPPGAVPELSATVAEFFTDSPVDTVVQPAGSRRKALLLADMDSTMIEQECIDELADFAGLKQQVAAITERAMRGEVAFEPALRQRVALLKGLPLATIDRVLADRITFTPGGATLVRTMRAHGAYCALVSGGFTVFTEPVAAALGFDEHRANRLDCDDERLSGTVAEPILGRRAKLARLLELRAERGLTPAATLAVGDGANDLAMLGEAGLGVAYHAKPAVAAAARARINYNDLTALLFAQGYARTEFLEAENPR